METLKVGIISDTHGLLRPEAERFLAGVKPRAHSDRVGDFLGPHGQCDDRRHHRGHVADAAVPAGALWGVVPDQGASTRKRSHV